MIADILGRKFPNVIWELRDEPKNADDFERLLVRWEGDIPKPTWEEVKAKEAEVLIEIQNERVNQLRKSAYERDADPLFFKWQAGEATQEEWQTKRNEIKARFPKE
jgi:hypothetical protein